MPTVRLTIQGMKCQGCASRVEESLQEVSGVQSAEANLNEGTAEVRVTAGETDADRIRSSVEDIGYDVTGLQGV